MAIESFEVSTSDEFGDLLNTKRETRHLKIGVYTSAYFEYFRMYPNTLRTFVESECTSGSKTSRKDLWKRGNVHLLSFGGDHG